MYDYRETELLRTLEAEEVGAARISKDMSPNRGHYGDYLLELGTRHRLVIYNGMDQWQGLGAMTCFPHGGHSRSSGTVVDYIMGSMEAASMITSLSVPARPFRVDHTFWALSLTGSPVSRAPPIATPHTTIYFSRES